MTIEELIDSDGTALHGALLSLWHDRRGEWECAHEVAQEMDGRDGSWVHAYLHRKEGDTMNAGYWYRRAGRPTVQGDLSAEWEAIVREMLAREQTGQK